jgi:hypothetical protein
MGKRIAKGPERSGPCTLCGRRTYWPDQSGSEFPCNVFACLSCGHSMVMLPDGLARNLTRAEADTLARDPGFAAFVEKRDEILSKKGMWG